MRKIIGLIVGAFIGAIPGWIIGVCIEIFNSLFQKNISGDLIFVIFCIVGACIGLWLGNECDIEKKEERKRELEDAERQQRAVLQKAERQRQLELERIERERKEAERQRQLELERIERERQIAFNNWKQTLDNKFREIEYMTTQELLSTDIYNKIFNEIPIGEAYRQYYYSVLNKHQNKMISDIQGKIQKNAKGLYFSLDKMYFLKASYQNDGRFDSAINKIKDFIKQAEESKPKYLIISNYGNCKLPLDNPQEMEYMNNNSDNIIKKLEYDLSCFSNNDNGYFDGIVQHMNKDFIYNVAKVMWYYAVKKPFNVNKFEEARDLYNKYTLFDYDNDYDDDYDDDYEPSENSEKYKIGKVEEILAVIYVRKQIGGEGTVQQERKYIDSWTDAKIAEGNRTECSIFASGLAWLELYDIELNVLRKMVQHNLQLSPDLQERLSFLENGGTTSNVKVYEVEPQSTFIYDSSSENWNQNQFDTFFRKVGMKKIILNYSLSIFTWKKTIPLLNNQNTSMNVFYKKFQSMVNDFNGEVICTRTKAQAINLDNLSYPDTVVFQFTSKRNKCLSMLFACEEFGKNLNLTIITLFTPDNNIDIENLHKYATAIKSNIYVDSFRETILQIVDDVIQEKREIYDDNNNYSSGKKFVE